MAIKQSAWARNQLSPPNPYSTGAVHVARYAHTFREGVAAADILDLGVLPAGAYIVGAQVAAEGTWIAAGPADITADIGIMSGEPGSVDPARTSDDVIFDNVNLDDAKTAIQKHVNPAALRLAASDKHRSIGIKFSADVAASASTKLILDVFYAQ